MLKRQFLSQSLYVQEMWVESRDTETMLHVPPFLLHFVFDMKTLLGFDFFYYYINEAQRS